MLVNPQEPPAGRPDYNVAPDQAGPGRAAPGPPREDRDGADRVRQLRLLTWGLVPSWAKDLKVRPG